MRTEDGHIIYKCLNEDPTAFGLLVDKYKASIFSIAYSKLRNFHDAEDVTQDVFIKAYENLRTVRRWDNFLAWLCSIAYNLCRNRIKVQSVRKENEGLDKKTQKELDDRSVSSYREKQAFESLHEALDSLPDIYREVLTLHYLGGISGEQIARILSIPHATVRQRLSRARAHLREEILAMVNETYEQQRLKASFTFRIVEMVKRIKVNPVSTVRGLPWGLSLATGIIIAVMSLNPYMSWFSQIGAYVRSVFPSETKVLKVGEIPVDVIKTSNIAILSSKMGKGKGGELKPDMQNAFFMASQGQGDTWAKKADMPTARAWLSTSEVNGKIYAIGGGNNNAELSTVEEYDPKTDTWTKKADMPTARADLATSIVNGKIYAIGGGTALTTVEEYDPLTDTWIKKADMPTGRRGLSTSSVNGKIYAIGGSFGGLMDKFTTVEEYDPETDTWTKKADMPTDREMLSTSSVNGKIYAIGGMGELPGWSPDLSVVEEYDPATDTWTRKADMPTARHGHSTSVVNGKIYAIAEMDWNVMLFFPTVEEYDPITDTWTKKADMPAPRQWLSTSAVDRKIYAIGGGDQSGTALSRVEEYDTGFADIGIEAKGKLPTKWGQLKNRTHGK